MPVLRIVRADSRDFDIIQRLTSHFRRDLRNFFLGPNRVFHEQRLRGARAASRAVRRLRAPTHQVFRIIEVPISHAFFAISKNSLGHCGRSREQRDVVSVRGETHCIEGARGDTQYTFL